MKAKQITVEKMDALLSFLPLFEAPGQTFVLRWAGGEETESGDLTIPYPVYREEVLQFFRRAGQPCWSDYDYEPRAAGRMVEDPAFIARASLEEIKTMLTFCVRGERFTDGHWERMLASGKITAILRRLAELRDELAAKNT